MPTGQHDDPNHPNNLWWIAVLGVAFTGAALADSTPRRVAVSVILLIGGGLTFIGFGRRRAFRILSWVAAAIFLVVALGLVYTSDAGSFQSDEKPVSAPTPGVSESSRGVATSSPNTPSQQEVLSGLRAEFTKQQFDYRLGKPLAKHSIDGYQSLIYRGHHFWVHALVRGGTVVMFAVTSCSSTFEPQFRSPGGPAVTLQRSTFTDLDGMADYHLFNVSTSGDSWAYDVEDALSATSFRAFAWGVSDACGEIGTHPPSDWGPISLIGTPRMNEMTDLAPSMATAVENWRARTAINTYAESLTNFSRLPGQTGEISASRLTTENFPSE